MPAAQEPKKQTPLPFKYQLLAGGVAGTSEILLLYPLDVIKTRMQIVKSVAHGDAKPAKMSLNQSFRSIIKNEGFGALYRGIIPPIMLEAPKRALKFSTNDQYTTMLKEQFAYFRAASDENRAPRYLLGVCTGVMAGATESVLVVPFDLIKINLQDPVKKLQYRGTWDCVRQLYQSNASGKTPLHGVAGFWRGAESTLWRHAIWSGTYFGLIGYLRDFAVVKRMKAANKDSVTYTNLLDFSVGTISATFSTAFNTPWDVVKSRIQSQAAVAGQRVPWAHTAIARVAREEGMVALWKGFVPKVVRLGPGGGVMLVIYTTITDYIRANWMPKEL